MFDRELYPNGLASGIIVAAEEEEATFIQYVFYDEELLHQTTNENAEIIVEENDEVESTEKNPLSKKALFDSQLDLVYFSFSKQ